MESPENHPKGSLVVSFLFLLEPKGDPAQRTAFGKEEGGCEYGAFAAPAEAEWSRLLLTLRRFFSFSEKRKKRMGALKNADGLLRILQSLRHLLRKCHLPLHKGGFPRRRGFLPQSARSADSPLLVEGAFVGPVFQPRCFAVMVCTSRAKTATQSTASSGNVQSSFPVFCRMISVRAARLSVCVSRKRTLPCPMTER